MEMDRNTEEEQRPFTPSKAPANTVFNDGPHKLNKQLILRELPEFWTGIIQFGGELPRLWTTIIQCRGELPGF
ncbi:MAG: hypothetical protein LBB80_11000 [Treponema sp.]|nr:hypothetical protein [Treponema sp.]